MGLLSRTTVFRSVVPLQISASSLLLSMVEFEPLFSGTGEKCTGGSGGGGGGANPFILLSRFAIQFVLINDTLYATSNCFNRTVGLALFFFFRILGSCQRIDQYNSQAFIHYLIIN